ncbi:MAG: tRNA (guanosine(37)-N1)-methyltransferase TrmD [Puniceicoccaceae bacterium]|nr:tRNA (guanosine(37)-N1)-methyltransferase TrmD [Puniceicoccaceae bacterium]RCL31980.1 MAG: tRNA (guanosine(37)-N1)-methyltransferase TrmD [Puniceicoccaceae bacterium]
MKIDFDILTLFPEMVEGFSSSSMLARAQTKGLIRLNTHNIRDWAEDKHKTTDDLPYGGGAGMVLRPEPIFKAIESLKRTETKVIYMAPDGVPLTTNLARNLAREKHLILLSGHYEGVDQRVRDYLVDEEISIGDFVLTNGTLPSIVLVDAVSRFIPGFLGDEKSLTEETFMNNLLAFPQYTRPAIFRDLCVPEVLLSGDHQAIEDWRKDQQLIKTQGLRPDLLENGD